MSSLRSEPPDAEGMRQRLDTAIWRWLAGLELSAAQQRIVDIHMRPGGCHVCRIEAE